MLLDREQARFYCIYSSMKPEQNGILSHIKLPVNWSRVRGAPGYVTEENVEELADILVSKLQNNLVTALLVDCEGDLSFFVRKAFKLIYGPIPFDVVWYSSIE